MSRALPLPFALPLTLVAALALAAPPIAQAAVRANRDAVLKLLGASERTPDERELRSLGAEVDEVLIELARDAKLEARMRARAVSALAFAPSLASRRYLDKVVAGVAAAKDPTDLLLVRRAAVALGWQGGPSVPPLLGGLLAHADPEVRIDAALALGLTRLAASADLLRARLDAETDARVRGHLSRQLRVIESALGLPPASP
jgi:HEAT repeat protein